LIDAIEAHDDYEMAEELGDLLLQVVFHCQLAKERGLLISKKSRKPWWTNWSAGIRTSLAPPR